ncbi:MAG: DUF87 domain-containing protein, partial [Candidatus Pacebacteria bacterium]|nr:DUF87 domain-containing protein [Candidatus Paceibacterota bacterium]
MSALLIFLVVVIGIACGVAAYFIVRLIVRRRFADSLQTSLFLIKVPRTAADDKNGGTEGNDFKSELAHFEQLLGSLASLKKPVAFEVAVPHVGEEIHFYIGVPKLSSETAMKQIQGLWNGASVEPVRDDFNIFNVHGATVAAYVTEKENYALPIRTYVELGVDSFESIVGAFAKINEIGEGASLQLLVRPAFKDSKKVIHRYIEFLKRGEKLEDIFKSGVSMGLSDAAKTLGSFDPEKDAAKREKEKVVDDEAIKALTAKAAKPLFDVNVRLVASAGSQFQADDILNGLGSGFSQFASPMRNGFRIVKPRNPKGLIGKFIYRMFDEGNKMTLSAEEIASIYHLPISSTETPRVKWLKSKEAAPPDNLPKQGLLLGESVFRGTTKPVYLTDDDRRRHLYVVGQTGTGKSTLLGNLIIEDIRSGKGVAIIDPHGDLVENALGFVPKERLDDVIYFNPGDLSRPLGLNMLDFNFDRPEEKTFIVNEMQSIFDKLFDQESMGPMFQQYMRNALLLLMEDMPNE